MELTGDEKDHIPFPSAISPQVNRAAMGFYIDQ
jgi:hypothetical protein